MNLFDTHAHLDDSKYDEDRDYIIETLKQKGITNLILSGYDLRSSEEVINLSEKSEIIYTTIGISPNGYPQDINNVWKELEELEKLLKKSDKIVGIGEIGLDYYWHKDNYEFQKKVFIEQIKLANKYNLPIAIHSREAWIDTIDILKNNPVNEKGVFHCCQFNMELIKEALKLGFYISIAGPITFKNTKNAEQIIEMIPLEKILIETDSPYLTPEPNRGKRNEPANVRYVAEKIAQYKKMSIEEISDITCENAKKLYKI